MKYDDTYILENFHKLMEALYGAGFCAHHSSLGDLTRDLCSKSNNLFRGLYLDYLGFRRNEIVWPKGEFDLLGTCNDYDDRERFFSRRVGGYDVHPDDQGLCLEDSKINFDNIRLFSFHDLNLDKKKKFGIENASSVVSRKTRQRLGNTWHADWFCSHQELIPEPWSDIILNQGGHIIFPKVRLCESRQFGGNNIFYSVLCADHHNASRVELRAFHDSWSITEPKSFYIATVGTRFKVPCIKHGSRELGWMYEKS